MGYHYVPRKYLQGFCESGSDRMLWQFDKKNSNFQRVSVGTVANEKDFYPPEIERKLATLIEEPGNAVIDKLRLGRPMDDLDRGHLSIYIATMLKRVPHHRKKALAYIPPAITETVEEIKLMIERAAEQGAITDTTKESRLAEADAIGKRFGETPPPQIMEQVRSPWPTQTIVDHIYSMTWRLFSGDGPSLFLTSDNPAYYFECYGLGNEKVELVFPLSTTLALHGSWQQLRPGERNSRELSQYLVREFNRRVAHAATRFVYYHEEKNWIREISLNQDPYLSHINFG